MHLRPVRRRARLAAALLGFLLAACAPRHAHVVLEIGEGGSATVDVPSVSGQIHGPFRYERDDRPRPASDDPSATVPEEPGRP